MSACPLCRQRKAKRPCPAKATSICSLCCGTKRRVEIDCPADCVYLKGDHAQGWEGRETERRRDSRRLAPHVEGLNDKQAELFFFALVGLHQVRFKRQDMDDRLLGEVLTAWRKTVETRASGIFYEHPPGDPRAERPLRDLQELFKTEGQALSAGDRDLLRVLQALEAALRETVVQGEGPTAFVDTIARLANRLGGERRSRPRPLLIEP